MPRLNEPSGNSCWTDLLWSGFAGMELLSPLLHSTYNLHFFYICDFLLFHLNLTRCFDFNTNFYVSKYHEITVSVMPVKLQLWTDQHHAARRGLFFEIKQL
jgi:hypothetical protein